MISIEKRVSALLIAIAMLFQLTACGIGEKASSIASSAGDTLSSAKDSVETWYNGIDFAKFKAGWDAAVDWMGAAYSAAASSTFLQTDYIQSVAGAINDLEVSINSAYGSARGIAQEAGFAAEKWTAGTFNIDAAARGSAARAEVVGSNELGSVDVATSYGEDASLKYYKTGAASGKAQAKTIVEAYTEYARGNPDAKSMGEYMDSKGYDYETQSGLLPLYDGQTRIIPTDQMPAIASPLRLSAV